ncbi:MAG: hypothetical protein UV65_C0035G0003 [Parcubacteria group bacterium GW2011_GWF2_43_11]|nr:MAG: hypothetical protein UV65_C0035G0003 [Parcubacteria group bacterium GW2011_GWF2_43_11]
MDLQEFILKNLEIDKQEYGRIFSFVDFGNVNYWYEKDRRDWDDNLLKENQKLTINIEKLAHFLNLFSEQKRFYYGWHMRIKSSWHIVVWAEKKGFIKITKPIQFIKHYLGGVGLDGFDGKSIKEDANGRFIEIPKSNFDVEISVDAIRLINKYDTFCLLSGDSDFTRLAEFLKRRGKKIIVIASGQVFYTLKDAADLYINAQRIKAHIVQIKETSPR